MKRKKRDEGWIKDSGVYISALEMRNREKVDGEPPKLFEVYQKFIETRRGNGKVYTQQIIRIMRETRNDWLRASYLKRKKICPEATLFRLLKALEKNKIIEKNKNPDIPNMSSYRLSPDYPNSYFYTDDEIREDHAWLREQNQLLSEKITHAIDFIAAKNLKEEYDMIDKPWNK